MIFKIDGKRLAIHVDSNRFESIPVNDHTLRALSEPTARVRSFTLTTKSLSLCITKDVKKAESKDLKGVIGIDRNLTNLAAGNGEEVTLYDMNKVVEIGKITRDAMKSFKRDDARIRKRLFSKYGRRKRERVARILHAVTKEIVERAKVRNQAIVFEDIRGIRALYRKGNGQSRSFRDKMNSWPFYEVKRQVDYKAAWEGIPVITLTRGETKGTTLDCPRCGKRSQVPVRSDRNHYRQLWCEGCTRWTDRDVAAVLNICRRGWLRFDHSSTEGEAGEAVKRDAEHEGEPLILRVDASKLHQERRNRTKG
jgi:putative transposase